MPTSDERFFALMRRWHAVNLCLGTLGERERLAIESLFVHRESIAECAKRLGTTKALAALIQRRAIKILSDMLCGRADDGTPTRAGGNGHPVTTA